MTNFVNFGGPLQQPIQQQMSQSQMLGRLLAQQQNPMQGPSSFDKLQSAILQKGMQEAAQRKRDALAIRQSANIPFTQQRQPDIDQLKQAQGLNLSRF